MSKDEEKEVKAAIQKERDALQGAMSDARRLRMELSLQSRTRYTEFQQKLGELSFVFGAAIIPLVIATNASKEIKYPLFVFTGVTLYLINGTLALWATKERIEQDGEESSHVGLDEEIHTYPIINAKNKLLLELHNDSHLKEHQHAEREFLEWAKQSLRRKSRITFLVEVLLFNFVVATLLVGGTVWPYGMRLYWVAFGAIVLAVLIVAALGYTRAHKNQDLLKKKHEQLNDIKDSYSKWREEKLKQ